MPAVGDAFIEVHINVITRLYSFLPDLFTMFICFAVQYSDA